MLMLNSCVEDCLVYVEWLIDWRVLSTLNPLSKFTSRSFTLLLGIAYATEVERYSLDTAQTHFVDCIKNMSTIYSIIYFSE